MFLEETLSILKKFDLSIDPSQDEQQLVDPDAIKLLIQSAGIQQEDRVLEVGPGAGNITLELVKTGATIITIEKNPKWMPLLKERLAKSSIELLNGDALKDKLPYFDRVVSNLPYNISEAFIQRLTRLNFKSGAFIVPSSFAKTVNAEKNEIGFSKLSYISKLFFDVKIITSIPKNAYYPKAGTPTSILKISPHSPSPVWQALLRETLKQGDKKLCNSLREAVIRCAVEYKLPSTKKKADAYLTEVFKNLNPECRVGRLSFKELQILSENLGKLVKASV